MIDLHFHSKYSDGKLSVTEIANKLIRSNIKYCALADHDSVNGLKKMKKELDNTSVNFITGVEMTALYGDKEIHILIYDFDIDKAINILEERNEIVEKQRTKELETAIKLFKKEGFKVSNNLKPAPKQPTGLTIALDVYNKKENRNSLIKKHGHLLNEEEFYNFYQAKGGPCHTPKSGVDANWVIKKFAPLTKNIILAHPFVPVSFTIKPLKKEDIIKLINMGITGIEVYHDKNSVEKIQFLEKFVAKNNLFYTGGSDSHFEAGNTRIGYYTNKDKIPSFKLHNINYAI
jgi:predicted metal-dependent phosphoesterase TrpH